MESHTSKTVRSFRMYMMIYEFAIGLLMGLFIRKRTRTANSSTQTHDLPDWSDTKPIIIPSLQRLRPWA
jgi:hypothetical protein